MNASLIRAILPVVCIVLACAASAAADDWNSSPHNWKNSSNNWENSSNNWKNSPHNWDNSLERWGNERVIRDGSGHAVGYAVPKEGGGVNFFDNEGNRTGYLPGVECGSEWKADRRKCHHQHH